MKMLSYFLAALVGWGIANTASGQSYTEHPAHPPSGIQPGDLSWPAAIVAAAALVRGRTPCLRIQVEHVPPAKEAP